ncbi:MAG: hypothetical protein U0U66_09210 [Cytophagaceae bacterium]
MGKNIGTENAPEIKADHPRVAAGLVGILGTWWLALTYGVILGLCGLMHKDGKTMFKVSTKAIILTLLVIMGTGILGLIYGKFFLTNSAPNWFIPENVINKHNYIMIGSMHNFGYFGGLIGLLTGVAYIVKQKNKIEATT